MKPVTPPSVWTEAWILRRLAAPTLFDGLTTSDARRERLREHLVENGLADDAVGMFKGRRETWAALFARVYKMPLVAAATDQASLL